MSQQPSSKVYELFKVELARHLAEAHSQLLEKNQVPSSECVTQLGRSFHTIKGGAGFLGFEEVASRAGQLDQLLRKSGQSIEENLEQVRSLLGELEAVAQSLPLRPKDTSSA
jgi:chemotaxis protein histidine kinase CheA